jgi:hypothetical protein
VTVLSYGVTCNGAFSKNSTLLLQTVSDYIHLIATNFGNSTCK